MLRWGRVSSMAIAAATALPFVGRADDAPASAGQEPSRELGTVTVIGRRPSSLPTQIPTTIEGIDGEDIRVRHQRDRRRGRPEVFPELGRSQALRWRLRPCRARNPRFGYQQQRPVARLCRRHPDLEPARQRRIVYAALGPRDTRGDRARRRALRAVLGGVSRQLRRRRRRLRDAHAGRARVERARVELQRGLPRLPLARDVRGTASERVGRQPPRPLVLVAELQPTR